MQDPTIENSFQPICCPDTLVTAVCRTTFRVYYSIDSDEYSTADYVHNPDLSDVQAVDKKYWKLIGDIFSEMTQEEKDTVDGATTYGNEKYLVQVYENNKLKTKTWYHTDNGDGTYSYKVKEVIYTYSGNKCISRTTTLYWKDGTARGTPETWKYYGAPNKKIEKRQ